MPGARRWIPAALVPGAVLAVDPWGLAPFGPIKWLVVPTLVLAALAVGGPGSTVDRRITGAWIILLAAVVVAAAGGLDPLYAWIGTPERRFGALTWGLGALAFVVGHRLDGPGRAVVVASASGTAVVLGLWSIAERLGWQPFDLVGVGDRPVGLLGSSAYLGAATVLLLPVALSRRRSAGVLAGVALVLSGARAAWVAGIATVGLMRRAAPRAVIAFIAGAVVLVLVTGLGPRAVDVVTDRDGGVRGRLDEWRVAVRVIGDHPMLGTGPEGYRIAFGEAVDAGYERRHGRDPLPDRAHSAPLDVAATLGIPGLVAYLALLGLVGSQLVTRCRAGDLVAAGVLAYWVQSLFLFPIAELEPVAWLFAGMAVGTGATARPARSRRGVTTAVAGAVAAVAVVAGGLDVVADHRARAALESVSPATADATGAARLRPDALRYRLAAARVLERRDSSLAIDQAIEQLEHALDVSPRDPVVGGEHARLLLVRAQRSGAHRHAVAARRALEDLADRDPQNRVVQRRLAAARALVEATDGT